MSNTIQIDIRKIALARANQGLNPRELASRAGVNPNVIYNMEKGASKPRIHTLGKITNALGKSLEEFLIED